MKIFEHARRTGLGTVAALLLVSPGPGHAQQPARPTGSDSARTWAVAEVQVR